MKKKYIKPKRKLTKLISEKHQRQTPHKKKRKSFIEKIAFWLKTVYFSLFAISNYGKTLT
jgi:hypothetical protein